MRRIEFKRWAPPDTGQARTDGVRLGFVLSVLVLLLSVSPVVAVGPNEPDEETAEPGEQAWDHEVEVSGGSSGKVTFSPVGVATSVVEPGDEPGAPRALADVITQVPGVSLNGQGGLFQVFSIRGVSRQRVSSYVGGIRITSDRRAGAAASFIDPTLIGQVSVLRGPATTFYGSGAIGGIVEVGPREFSGWGFGVGYESNGDQNYQTVGSGGSNWSIGAARRSADEAVAGDGARLHSGFTQYSAVMSGNWKKGALTYELSVIPSRGEDIGKANTDFPERTTDYPLERHGLVQFRVTSDRRWQLQAAVHAQDLQTRVVEQSDQTQSDVFNDSFDFALDWNGDRDAGDRITVSYGIAAFGRRGVDAREEVRDLTVADAPILTFQTLDGATETELGAFGSARWTRDETSWEVGTRYSWVDQSNSGIPGVDRGAWNGHAGVVHSLGGNLELRSNLGSGVRFPTLTELFFAGTTGRGQVLGNPELDPERSVSLEASLQWTHRRLLLGGGLFGNRITDFIERVEISPDLLTFRNIRSGTIVGIELQGVARLSDRWSLSWGGHLMDSKDDDGRPLADVPPAELWLAAARSLGRWDFEVGLSHHARRDDPGPGEKPIPSAQLLTAAVSYGWGETWHVALSGTNLLDETYFASADRKAAAAPGHSFTLQLIRSGG